MHAMWTKTMAWGEADAWRQGAQEAARGRLLTRWKPVMTGEVRRWAFELVVIGLLRLVAHLRTIQGPATTRRPGDAPDR